MTGMLLSAVVLIVAFAGLQRGPVIQNASFEDDGSEIQGVGYIAHGNALSGWRASFPLGVARNTQDGPFVDNGLVPDGKNVCILQNLASISQTVRGLRPDAVYRLSIRANARASDAPRYGGLRVELNDAVLLDVPHVEPVGRERPYRLLEAYFTGASGAAELIIRQTNPASGVSVLVDDIRMEVAQPGPGVAVHRVNPATPVTGPGLLPEQDLTDVRWIWADEARRGEWSSSGSFLAPPGTRHFRRTFALAVPPVRAVVTFTADDACRLRVNGRLTGWSQGHTQLRFVEVTHLLRTGENVLEVEATNGGTEPNPAGLILKLVVTQQGKPPVVVTTDERWTWRDSRSRGGAGRPKPVRIVGLMGSNPWGWVGPPSSRVSRWFPDFRVPGDALVPQAVRRLFSLHFAGGRPACTLWDGWLPLAGLWPVAGEDLADRSVQALWRQVLLSRDIDAEGYVASHQHHGYGHSRGWPIPLYMQTGGIGFHFSRVGDPFGQWVPRDAEPAEWSLDGLVPVALDRARGWELRLTGSEGAVTSPGFRIPMAAAPFVRLEWRVLEGGLVGGEVLWRTGLAPNFGPEPAMALDPPPPTPGVVSSDVPIYRTSGWSPEGEMTRLRLALRGEPGTHILLRAIMTPADTRHNINNPCFLQGSCIYLDWTGDLDFLRRNIERMRRALAYSLKEFRLAESLCVDMPWFGHDGRSGFERLPDGSRKSRYAVGVGNNYWDLLPFGGKDCLATIYHYDALRRMARLERLIRANPAWGLPEAPPELAPERLEDLARRIRDHAGRLFWNAQTGRFVACIGSDGVAHDYGYTIVNLEAIYYGFATPEQAASIFAWLDGRRIVEGDTSQGPDIYRWRFGPRCSTKRNTDWYSGMWEPLNVPFGDQVQDGGGVLGFSYFDLMARLRTLGPDDALRRLLAIAEWFVEVQAEGGYRSYYAKPGRGTLQGGGPPGGLGLDHEFVESVLVPQVMLYGFLGFEPGLDGFRMRPKLPSAWPSLTVTRVRYHGLVMDLTAHARGYQIRVVGGKPVSAVRLKDVPPGWKAMLTSGSRRPRSLAVVGGAVHIPAVPGAVVSVQAPQR